MGPASCQGISVRHASRLSTRVRFTIACALVAALAVLPARAVAAGNPPGVIPPNASFGGQSYAQWSAAWWQFDLSMPVHDPSNPSVVKDPQFLGYDPAQVDCSFHQSGHVWFLQGASNSGVAHRSCTLPSGTPLFFPIVDTWGDDSNWDGLPWFPFTTAELRALIAPLIDGITSMTLIVDGRVVPGVTSPSGGAYQGPYRVQSPVFGYTVGADNWIDETLAGPGQHFSAQTVTGAVADGVYVMLAPLSVGTHVIHWTASGGGFLQDITYTLTVRPAG